MTERCARAVVPSGDVMTFNLVRFFISWCGAAFVTTVLWVSKMFASNVVGLAGAAAAGWGNFGGGVTLAIMPAAYSTFKSAGYTTDQAWRNTLAIPPSLLLLMGVLLFCLTDDSPNGRVGGLHWRKQVETLL